MLVESFAHLEALVTQRPEHWLPDNLLLLQEYFPTDLAKQKAAPPVESYPYPDVPAQAVEWGKRIIAGGKLDVGGVEYLEAQDGRLMFYDVNANSNLARCCDRVAGR